MNTYEALIRTLKYQGWISSPRGQEIRELLGRDLIVTDHDVLIDSVHRNTVDPTTPEGKYLRAEFMWYMSGNLDPDYISRFGKMWNSLKNVNSYSSIQAFVNKVNSNYGYHVFWKPVIEAPIYKSGITHDIKNSPFEYVIKTLSKDIFSRQAIIQYTLSNIYEEGVNDFTCTQNQHFLVRNNYLYNLVHIRSSDAVKGLTFDIPWWDIVGQFVAGTLNVNYNGLYVFIGSAHFYEKDLDLINNLLEDGVKWRGLILRPKCELIDNMKKIIDSMCEYAVATFNRQVYTDILLLNDYYFRLVNIQKSGNISLKDIITSYLHIASKFVDLTTNYVVDNATCEHFNNVLFDSIFCY